MKTFKTEYERQNLLGWITVVYFKPDLGSGRNKKKILKSQIRDPHKFDLDICKKISVQNKNKLRNGLYNVLQYIKIER